MSVEAHHSLEHLNPAEQIRGVEMATKAIMRVRLLLAEHLEYLELEHSAKVIDLEMIKHLNDMIEKLRDELEGNLAFLEEFDPLLFRKLKDNS